MYHIIIFFCPDEILSEVINRLTCRESSPLQVQVKDRIQSFFERASLVQEPGENGFLFSHHWTVTSSFVSQPLPLFDWASYVTDLASLARLDCWIEQCASVSPWCLVPWSTPGFYPTAAVISKDEQLVTDFYEFLNRDHAFKPPDRECDVIRPFISRYSVANTFSRHSRLITFGEYGEWGHRAWDVHECDWCAPYVLFHRRSLLWNWDEIDCEDVLQYSDGTSHSVNRGIYRPADKENFVAMTATTSANGDEYWVLPGDTPLEIIQDFAKTVLTVLDFKYVHRINQVLEKVRWAYTPLKNPTGESYCFSSIENLSARFLAAQNLETTRSFGIIGLF